jgi:hypothetical protein
MERCIQCGSYLTGFDSGLCSICRERQYRSDRLLDLQLEQARRMAEQPDVAAHLSEFLDKQRKHKKKVARLVEEAKAG